MNTFIPIILFSAERSELSFKENQERTNKLVDIFIKNKVKFEAVTGVYLGSNETSFLLSAKHESLIKELASIFNQECYLIAGANRETFLVYPTHETFIGRFKSVSQSEAEKLDSYTFHQTKGYFAVI